MRVIRKEIKQSSLIHQRIRGASFVSLESEDTKKFKYNLRLKLSEYFGKKFIALRTIRNKFIQKPQLWLQEINLKAIRGDVLIWSIEALIEGFITNFVFWALLGWEFNLWTMIAWGFAIKQLLSISVRLRKNGASSTIPTKNK